jgi:hypothetical protein
MSKCGVLVAVGVPRQIPPHRELFALQAPLCPQAAILLRANSRGQPFRQLNASAPREAKNYRNSQTVSLTRLPFA